MHGCGEKIDSSDLEASDGGTKDKGSVFSRVDEMATRIIESYSSIEKSFAKAEDELLKSDRTAQEILSELKQLISNLDKSAKAMESEIGGIMTALTELQGKFDKLAKGGPSSERTIFDESKEEVSTALEKKVTPMHEFDIPYLQKAVYEIDENMGRWQSTYAEISKLGEDGARKVLSQSLANHFKKMAKVIRDRKASLSSSQ